MKKVIFPILMIALISIIAIVCLLKAVSDTAINFIEYYTGETYYVTSIKYDPTQALFDIIALSNENTTKIWCQVSLLKKNIDGNLNVEIMTVTDTGMITQ